MKGNNELRLCPLQMIEIVQQWLDEHFIKSVVAGVSVEHSPYDVFIVQLTEAPKKC